MNTKQQARLPFSGIILIGKQYYCEAISSNMRLMAQKQLKLFSFSSETPKICHRFMRFLAAIEAEIADCTSVTVITAPAGSIVKNTSDIASLEGILRRRFPSLRIKWVGPDTRIAEIIEDKVASHTHISGLTEVRKHAVRSITDIYDIQPPFIIKHRHESGGRQIDVIRTREQVDSWKVQFKSREKDFYIEDFVTGLEITQALLLHQGKVTILPQSIKPTTSAKYFLHSDAKPKFAGAFPQCKKISELSLKVASLFSFDGILACQFIHDGDEPTLIELETRITGSMPIMARAARKTISDLLLDAFVFGALHKNAPSHEVQFIPPTNSAVQYITHSERASLNQIGLYGITEMKRDIVQGEVRPRYTVSICGNSIADALNLSRDYSRSIKDGDFYSGIIEGYRSIQASGGPSN